MQNFLRKRIDRDEEGFTLIELMVVVMIIAILIAIAVPTFLGARERSQERAAQSNIRTAFTAAKTLYTDSQAWDATVTEAALDSSEPSVDYMAAASTDAKDVSFAVTAATDTIVLVVRSANDKCFWMKDVAGTTSLEKSDATAAGTCVATAPPATMDGW